jgi:hypothetical protein
VYSSHAIGANPAHGQGVAEGGTALGLSAVAVASAFGVGLDVSVRAGALVVGCT